MGNLTKSGLTLLLLVLFAASAAGATVTLENGDRLTGAVRGIEDGRLKLLTEHMGEVYLDLEAVAALSSEEPLAVFLPGGTRVVGRLEPADGSRVRILGETGAFLTPITGIEGLAVSPSGTLGDLERAIEVLAEGGDAEPSPWSAKIEFGADYSAGNTDRRGFHAAFSAKRESPDDIFSVKASAYYAEEDDVRTVNEQHLRFREDIKFDPWYVFALLAFERDEFEDLDLRVIFAPGVGRILADSEDFKAKAEIGPSITYEDYRTDDTDTIFQLRIGFYAEAKVFEQAKITEELEIFPGFTNSDVEWRIVSETAFENPLSENLFFKLGVRWDYNSDVADGVENWDLKVLASLVYEF